MIDTTKIPEAQTGELVRALAHALVEFRRQNAATTNSTKNTEQSKGETT